MADSQIQSQIIGQDSANNSVSASLSGMLSNSRGASLTGIIEGLNFTVEGVEKTKEIEKDTVVLEQTLSKEPATLSFRIKGEKTKLSLGDSVELTEDDSFIFSGTIVEINAVSQGNVMTGYEYICMDGYYELDKRLVTNSYTNVTANDVIRSIFNEYVDNSVTLNLQSPSPAIETARFNYEQPSRCIQKIANSIGWDWYIDAENVLNFFDTDNKPAPFTAEDDNDTVIASSLSFNSNITELQNFVFIRGGEYTDNIIESDAIDKYKADGEQNTFPLVYRYENVKVSLNGTELSVGVDFVNDFSSFDVLYNFQEKLVRWPEASKPAQNDVVRVYGDALIPLIVSALDTASINQYGRREGVELDKNITSIEEAELLANSLLDKWKEGSREGSFTTRKKGLRVGQTVQVTSTRFGVNKEYVINRILGTVKHHNEFLYDVEFIASGQTRFNDIMIDLIGRQKENVEISPDEVLQILRQTNETFGITDEIVSVTSAIQPDSFEWSPVTTGDEGKWNFFTWS